MTETEELTTETVKAFFSELSDDACKTIADLITGKIELDPDDIPERFEGTIRWLNQCHNYPNNDELIMSALNDTIEGFGIEGINDPDDSNNCIGSYVNTGDTYSGTVVLDDDGNFHLTTWGDFYSGWIDEENAENDTIQCGWCSHLTPLATLPVPDDECPNCQNGTIGLQNDRLVCRGECGNDFGGVEDEVDWRKTICEQCGNYVNGDKGPNK